MPQPSQEASARRKEKGNVDGYYEKDGKRYYTIHLFHPCGCCWIRLTRESSYGNGYCNVCMEHMRQKIDLPCPQWTTDMKKAWEKHQYLDRYWFNMELRILFSKRYENI